MQPLRKVVKGIWPLILSVPYKKSYQAPLGKIPVVYFWRIWLDILSNYGQNLDQNHPHSFIFGGFIIIIWLVVSTHLKSSWSSKWVHNFPNFRGENFKKNELPPASHISTSWNLTFQLPDFPHRTAAVWTLALQGSSDGPAVALGTFVFWPKAPQAPLNLLIMFRHV